jgi:hypothetical protein
MRQPGRHTCVTLGLLLAVFTADVAYAQKGFIRHKVVAGDTLESIGARYLAVPAAWMELQTFNRLVDPEHLKRGSVIRLPQALLRPAGTTLAKVEFVQGQTTSGKPESAGAQFSPLSAGDTIAEGMRIQVPKDGYLRLRLADGSVVRVLAESDIQLKRLRAKRPTGPFESIIDVRAGKVESEVAKQPKGRVFEIHAPGAIASVRGTRFDVSVGSSGQIGTAVSEGVVMLLQPKNARRKRVQTASVTAGQGAMIDSSGKMGQARPLPQAPDLNGLPDVYEDANVLTFTLDEVSGIRGYEVRVARDDGMHEVLRNGVFQGYRAQFSALDDGFYTVGVRALDSDGLAGPESQHAFRIHAYPVPPLYQSPAPGARVTSEAGQLICSETADSSGTHLQVSSRPDFSQPEIDQTELKNCRFGIATLKPGNYFWRVAATTAQADSTLKQGPFATPQSFTVAITPNVAGVEADEDSDNPTLRWSGRPGETFRGQLARDAAFTHIVLESELGLPTWTLSGQPRGIYFVRLEAKDASGLVGPFSPARRVRIGSVVQTSGGSLGLSDGSLVERP